MTDIMFAHEYIGNVHIHTIRSDGGKDIEEIADIAQDIGLDFICITDHDFTQTTLPLKKEGFYGDIAVLIGLEIGKDDHHYLAFGIKELIRYENLRPQEIIDKVHSQGGFGFLAHPFEKGMPFFERSKAYIWRDLRVKGFTGICIWNFMSRWKERIKSPIHGIVMLCFKREFLKGPSKKTMEFYDTLCLSRKVVAIGGSDAHGTIFKYGPFSFTPISYKFLLNSINIHIFLNSPLPREFKEAKELIYDAIKNGRLFIAHDGLSPSKNFRFEFVSLKGSDLFMGEESSFEEGYLLIQLPSVGQIRIVRNGRVVRVIYGIGGIHRVTEEGVYRVEVYKHIPIFGWRPWIFSNPVYLR